MHKGLLPVNDVPHTSMNFVAGRNGTCDATPGLATCSRAGTARGIEDTIEVVILLHND